MKFRGGRKRSQAKLGSEVPLTRDALSKKFNRVVSINDAVDELTALMNGYYLIGTNGRGIGCRLAFNVIINEHKAADYATLTVPCGHLRANRTGRV